MLAGGEDSAATRCVGVLSDQLEVAMEKSQVMRSQRLCVLVITPPTYRVILFLMRIQFCRRSLDFDAQGAISTRHCGHSKESKLPSITRGNFNSEVVFIGFAFQYLMVPPLAEEPAPRIPPSLLRHPCHNVSAPRPIAHLPQNRQLYHQGCEPAPRLCYRGCASRNLDVSIATVSRPQWGQQPAASSTRSGISR